MSIGYRKLGRNSSQRKALLRDLVTDLIIHNQIETTYHKAKELQRLADRMVTLAKKGDLASRRQAAKLIRFEKADENQLAIQKLFDEIAPKYTNRKGGYTSVLRAGVRRGDAAEMAVIMFVEE